MLFLKIARDPTHANVPVIQNPDRLFHVCAIGFCGPIPSVATVHERPIHAFALYTHPVVWHTRSGDVGLGLNARRLRDNFLKNFSITYSLRPIGDVGSVYRRYPSLWQVRGRFAGLLR